MVPLVAVTLLLDALIVAPGEPLTAAARFDIAPGWHIYWDNPGDSGVPTTTLFRIGDTEGPGALPGPNRFVAPGGVVGYGWEDQVVAVGRLVAPTRRGRFTVEAEVRWLACRDDACVPGEATLSAQGRVGRLARPSADAARVIAAVDAVPEDAPVPVEATADGFSIVFPGVREVFPEAAVDPWIVGIDLGGSVVHLSLTRPPPDDAGVVVRVDAPAGPRYHRVVLAE